MEQIKIKYFKSERNHLPEMTKQYKFIVTGIVDYVKSEQEAKQYLDRHLRGSSMKSVDSIWVAEINEETNN